MREPRHGVVPAGLRGGHTYERLAQRAQSAAALEGRRRGHQRLSDQRATGVLGTTWCYICIGIDLLFQQLVSILIVRRLLKVRL